jgi:predicted dehydrogenase
MTESISLGLIGAGGIANAYSAALGITNKFNLTSVCDIDRKAAEDFAAKHGARAFTVLDEMLDKNSLDAVVICTPPAIHARQAIQCAENGLHVMCEKPVSIASDHARQMIQSAKENQVLLTMASKFRFVEDIAKARKLVDQGVIGDVILFENSFTGQVDMTTRWNSNPSVSGGGVLIDNGTHSLDIMRYFLGPLVRIKAVECHRIQDLVVEDTVRVFVETESGIVGNIDLSWSINKQLENFVSLFGADGTLHVGWQQSKYKRHADAEWTVFGSGYDKNAAFAGQLKNFAEAILGNESLIVTPEDALASVVAVEAAYESMRDMQWHLVGNESASVNS